MAVKNITTKTVVNALGCDEAYFGRWAPSHLC